MSAVGADAERYSEIGRGPFSRGAAVVYWAVVIEGLIVLTSLPTLLAFVLLDLLRIDEDGAYLHRQRERVSVGVGDLATQCGHVDGPQPHVGGGRGVLLGLKSLDLDQPPGQEHDQRQDQCTTDLDAFARVTPAEGAAQQRWRR